MASSVRFAAAASLIAAAFFPGNARAQSVTVHDLDPHTGAALKQTDTRVDYLSLGPILSLVGGFHHATGVGVEGSWMAYPSGTMPSFGLGPFVQGQLYDGKYLRTALGVEGAAGPGGIELGLAFRQTDGTYASTIATHTSVFLSIGYFYIAVRASAQLLAFPTSEPSFGLETAFTVGLKLPIAIRGRDPTGYAVQATGNQW